MTKLTRQHVEYGHKPRVSVVTRKSDNIPLYCYFLLFYSAFMSFVLEYFHFAVKVLKFQRLSSLMHFLHY